jgi:hypothetical protein
LRREAEHFGDGRQRPAAVLDQAQREVGALGIKDLREAGAAFAKMAVDGAPRAAKMLGDAFHGAVAVGLERAHHRGLSRQHHAQGRRAQRGRIALLRVEPGPHREKRAFLLQLFRPAELLALFRCRKYRSAKPAFFDWQDSAREARPRAVFLLPSVRNSYDMSRNRPAKGREKCVKP